MVITSPNDLIERSLRLSATDIGFRERLLADPHSATQQIAPGVIAPNARIKFIEKPDGVDALYVLPALAWRSTLPEEELEAIVRAGPDADSCAMPGFTCWATCNCGDTCNESCEVGISILPGTGG